MSYAVCTLNRVGKSSVEGKTPFEVFFCRDRSDLKIIETVWDLSETAKEKI